MAGIPDQSGDRLELAWRALGSKIRERERELAELKREFAVLDEARALLIMRESGPRGSVFTAGIPAPAPKLGLSEAVVASVRGSEMGLSFSELCEAVKARVDGERYASLRSFVAAVQTTVRRLVARSHLAMTMTEGVARYVSGPEAFSEDGKD